MDLSLTESYTIRSFDADINQRASLPSLCNYMQEIVLGPVLPGAPGIRPY